MKHLFKQQSDKQMIYFILNHPVDIVAIFTSIFSYSKMYLLHF